MNKVFEKILERLGELHERYVNQYGVVGGNPMEFSVKECMLIVQEVAEEYNGGWIPCSKRLPSGLDFVLYTHKDGEVDICSIEYFYDYLDKFTAWQPLPEPYKERD